MKREGMVRAIIGMIMGTICLGIGLSFFIGPWGLILIAFGILLFLLSFIDIPADPPHVAQMTVWGERNKGDIKDEGYRLRVPIRDGYILVDMTKRNNDEKGEAKFQVRTPDMALLDMPTGITWYPLRSYLINFLDRGGEAGVWKILNDIIQDRSRTWAMNEYEGPSNFREALGAKPEAVHVLIKAIAGAEMNRIPSRIPTPVLFKYFNQPQEPPNHNDAKVWGPNWEKAEKVLQQENIEEIKKALEDRREAIKKIQNGSGEQEIPSLGICLTRFNLKDINIAKGTLLYENIEKRVKEEADTVGEEEQFNFVERSLDRFERFGREAAQDIVQIERDKKTKHTLDIPGLDKMGEAIGTAIGAALNKGKGEDKK